MQGLADRITGLAVAAGLVARGRLGRPPAARGLAERLAMLPTAGWPLRAPVSIRWNDYAVPFIEAEHDDDLAVALGAVQAHLRLAQLQIMRRIALGRVAEMAGPLGITFDRALRSLGFAEPVPGIIARLSPDTRRWAEGFLAGINHHIATARELPYDCRLLGIGRETWTMEDLFTVARLAGADVSWVVFARLIRAQRQLGPRWDAVWQALLRTGSAAPGGVDAGQAGAEEVLTRLARMGSNSAAVAGRRSASGAAMIASDPHLGLGLPNLWLIAGFRSPSYHVVGLMLAGFPFVALGRNPWCAWGGTSLHAASSDLVDLTGHEAEITERRVSVQVRGIGRREITLRESRFGPVVSDGPLLRAARPRALRWAGQAPSDELGAMLGAMRARDWEGFRGAFQSFAVPGQTMVFAGADGRLGRLLAGHLPRRPNRLPEDLAIDPAAAWDPGDLAVLSDEAFQADPPEGYVASANDRPPDLAFPIGFFFSPPDRVTRLRALLSRPGPLTLADMRALQADVANPGALRLCDALVRLLPAGAGEVRDVLLGWDGTYGRDSAGALVFEVLLGDLARDLPAARRLRPVAGIWTGRMLVTEAILRSPEPELRAAMERAARRARRRLRRYRGWGRIHRVPLRHPLSRLPLVGRHFRFGWVEAAGSNDTLNKTGHGFVLGPHEVGFGTCARHISDLADPDANHFVLLGGQDGWIGSANAVDQAPLWQRGQYIQVPMRPEAVAASFPHRTVLRPV